MKRYFNKREKSPVRVYRLFKYQEERPDGAAVIYPAYYTRHAGKTISLKTEKLSEAKTKIKKIASDDTQNSKRRSAPIGEVRVGQKTVRDVKRKIQHGLRPFFGEILADRVDSVQIGRWKDWRFSHRLRKSGKPGCDKLMPASINRELSILRRGQLETATTMSSRRFSVLADPIVDRAEPIEHSPLPLSARLRLPRQASC